MQKYKDFLNISELSFQEVITKDPSFQITPVSFIHYSRQVQWLPHDKSPLYLSVTKAYNDRNGQFYMKTTLHNQNLK